MRDLQVSAGRSADTPSPAGLEPKRATSGARRLSAETHELARRAMSGEHGGALVPAPFGPDHESLQGLSADMQYAQALMLMCELAPLRILPGELVVGSATLREAAYHTTPGLDVPSTSHTTVGFDRALKIGYRGLRREIEDRLSRNGLDERGREFLRAMLVCLQAAGRWHQRHMDLLAEMAQQAGEGERESCALVRDALSRVPEEPPKTFHEAVQALWFMFALQRLAGNWSGIGRIDEMLGPFLANDLAQGRIALDEAREILAHFWIKGCEWTGAHDFGGSGDAQHYQNIVLSGVDARGQDVTNEVTYLVLDIVEELHISDFPIAIRLSSASSERLLRRIAQVQRHGGGIVAVYNEETVIEGLTKFGYSPEDARGFANDGCWEVIMPGRTAFSYRPFDALAILHELLGLSHEGPPCDYPDFETLYADYMAKLGEWVDEINLGADAAFVGGVPAPLLSVLVQDCIEKARGYHDRGARYTVAAPHAGGMANVANSLATINKLVYDEARMRLSELVEVLRGDWQGHEDLRRQILNRFPAYGNDDPEADAMMQRLFNDYTDLVWRIRERKGVLRPAGISTFGREIEWSKPDGGRRASPDGHHRGEALATNFSPSPGTDREGPSAVIKSYCSVDLTRVPNGATIELKVHPGGLEGEKGVAALVTLMRSFVSLGGLFMQVDVVDNETLRDAQRHPEKYPNLAVRISGWSARFVTLNEQWQNMIINRTEQSS